MLDLFFINKNAKLTFFHFRGMYRTRLTFYSTTPSWSAPWGISCWLNGRLQRNKLSNDPKVSSDFIYFLVEPAKKEQHRMFYDLSISPVWKARGVCASRKFACSINIFQIYIFAKVRQIFTELIYWRINELTFFSLLFVRAFLLKNWFARMHIWAHWSLCRFFPHHFAALAHSLRLFSLCCHFSFFFFA